MSLTDDWKNGKLKWDKYYYCKACNNTTIAMKTGERKLWSREWEGLDPYFWEVVAEVPSYEELQRLESKLKHLLDLQANQDQEIEALRDLLKECKEGFEDGGEIEEDLLIRIYAAIGESEE